VKPLSVLVACLAASSLLVAAVRPAAAESAARHLYGTFSMDLPHGWSWRPFPKEPSGSGGWFSNSQLSPLGPPERLGAKTSLIVILPEGQYGSVTKPTIQRKDFKATNDPSLPRGEAEADHFYCSRQGRCFAITLLYGSRYVPDKVLTSVNRALSTLRATPLPR
jgi:hypothetical protein